MTINPASVQPPVIFKTLWLRAFFSELLKKKDVRLVNMEIKRRWIYRTKQNICHENSETFHFKSNVKMLFFRFAKHNEHNYVYQEDQ